MGDSEETRIHCKLYTRRTKYECMKLATRVAFVDIEASGLGSNSFPTEIGWAVIEPSGPIRSGSCLIRPEPNWMMYKNAWSAASERLTGISQSLLFREGLPPSEAMGRFLDAVGQRHLVSDKPDFDQHWMDRLAKAAGVESPQIADAAIVLGGTAIIGSSPEIRHRAEPDAVRLAQCYAPALGERKIAC